ncbi:GNAT family N-acetyltransferase [Shewanella woodyi]|uniref:GCN5-related N-acetyltransferase n=1 Tax=Shewanella woodyi (strain ATCC 51908 / MS32) TaxID=392500 RepID=B1KJ74_SHEWM|nr:GNAT family N-acetyltransferase [Shewanella woodyi]ACA87094.1 GCN5-related N-acetyltransferase [Shewanella woodyi ATCC 51908]
MYLRDDAGQVIAGLTGKIFGGWLHVEFLWVDEAHRNKDYGAKILSEAENEAISKGCKASSLDTFSFQALNFYLKQGYEVVGELDGYYGTHRRHYLRKQLTRK